VVVGQVIPEDMVHLAYLAHAVPGISGKRLIEDATVDRCVSEAGDLGISVSMAEFRHDIERADWYVLSARRADNLLRELLFDRAYALRVRAFARNYRGAELDMHFSLSQDLHPLNELFAILRDAGLHGLTARLERGSL
jgi:hypothetical protein